MQVKSNVASYNVWKNYTNNVNSLRKSMSKLSSGQRINNAGDDPSGLAMSERLRTQARNTAAAASNVENKLNYLQTADSWMQKMHDMLGRMGELAVMANDGTKSATDTAVLQNEFAQMQDEIKRITTGADSAGKFNGIQLFQAVDGADAGTELDGVVQQVGADGNQTFEGVGLNLTTANATVIHTDLGDDGAAGGTGADADTDFTWGNLVDSTSAVNIGASGDPGVAVSVVNAGIDYLSEQRSAVGAELKRMEHTLEGLHSYEENISATESRIRDVDVAKETAEMSKYNILQQVGTAMMAQANQLPQGVLQLVG